MLNNDKHMMQAIAYVKTFPKKYQVNQSVEGLKLLYTMASKVAEKPKARCLEIGSCGGNSTHMILSALSMDSWLTCIDITITDNLKAIIKGVGPAAYLVQRDSTSFINDILAVKEDPNASYDFIHIDGAHDYESVKSDLKILQLLKPGGYAMLHDYYSPIYGVSGAVDEFALDNQDWGLVTIPGINMQVANYCVLQKPNKI